MMVYVCICVVYGMYGGLKLLALSGAQGMLMYIGLSVAIAHSTFKHQTDGDVA